MKKESPLERMFSLIPGIHCANWNDGGDTCVAGVVGFMAASAARFRIVGLLNPFLATRLTGSLREAGHPCEPLLLTGRMVLQTSREAFLQGDRLSARKVLAFLEDQQRRALAQGHPGLRAVLDMAWLGGGTAGLTDLKELEWLLHDFAVHPGTRVLCHYDLERFPAEFLGSVLEMHEILILGEHGGANPFFTFFRGSAEPPIPEQILQFRQSVLRRWFSAIGSLPLPSVVPSPGEDTHPADLSLASEPPAAGLFPAALRMLFTPDLSLDRVFAGLLEDARRTTGGEAGLAAVLDPYADVLVIRVVDPPLEPECQPLPGVGAPVATLRPEGPLARLAAHIMTTRKGFFSNDFRRHPMLGTGDGAAAAWGKVLALPFFTDRDPSGVLLMVSSSRDFSPTDLLRGQEFSQAFGLAVLRSQLLTQMQMLEAMVQRTTAAIAVTTVAGRVLSWNPVFERLLGETPSATHQVVLPDHLLRPATVPPPTLAAALTEGQPWSGCLPARDGVSREVTVTPFAQELGGFNLLIWVFPEATAPVPEGAASLDPVALGRLQSLMADFQNGVAMIIGNLSTLRISFEDHGSGQVEAVREIKGAVDRVWNLLTQMKTLVSPLPTQSPPMEGLNP